MDLYSTADLLEVIGKMEPVSSYWTDLCFPETYNSDKEEIMFDLISKDRRMAPFVSPMVEGKVMSQRGYTTSVFKPAYLKPKAVVDPNKIQTRLAGEAITGTLTLQQRYDAAVAGILADHNTMHQRRREWMSAEAIIKGSITVSGDSYETANVNFGRAVNQDVTLSGGALWSAGTANPLADLETWSRRVQKSTGYPITRFTMGLDAWDAFVTHPAIQAYVEQRRAVSIEGTIAPVNGAQVAEPRLRIGKFEIWTYYDVYEADNGSETEFLDSKSVIGTAPAEAIKGLRCYGAIMDSDASYQTLELFPKMWKQQDPSVTFLMTQSAPLMVPRRINGTLAAKVLA